MQRALHPPRRRDAFILELFRNEHTTKALVVEDALACGACHPRPDPVELPDLGGA